MVAKTNMVPGFHQSVNAKKVSQATIVLSRSIKFK